jgi:hypothetical protein
VIFELTLGFILAAVFVMAYLAIRRLWTDDGPSLTGNPPPVTLRPADYNNAIGPGNGVPALTPAESVDDSNRRS